ncbi:MAG: hypothetical protein HOP02_14565 [Methylococcaceae bacterium]|nr:hypothetical protein [Methylococcaceae bacterium]
MQKALEESNLPFKVDLLIWDDIPENFKSTIQGLFVELAAHSGMTQVQRKRL